MLTLLKSVAHVSTSSGGIAGSIATVGVVGKAARIASGALT